MAEVDIEKLKNTVLYKELDKRENLLNEHEVSTNLLSVVRETTPLLERIPEMMPEFTLHNANHSVKVVELMGKIIPSKTLENLNIIELSILIYSAYLHDIGMTASRDEREEIIRNDHEFTKLLISDEELSLKQDKAKKNKDHRTVTLIEDKIFTEFLRRKHVERSRNYIQKKYGLEETRISWKKIPYYELVQYVCDSHSLPVDDLYDTKIWRQDYLIGEMEVNVQYLSIILRLADILDFDPERTPRCLLDFINPTDENSIKEWKKHLSIIGYKIHKEEIKIEAKCEHPIYERTLREFIDEMEIERKESIRLISHYNEKLANKYCLDLSKSIKKENIRSNGKYIYSDFHFKLDFRRTINIFMGEKLYGDSFFTLRELLQNSVDAVRYRQIIEEKEGNLFPPLIKITLKSNELIIEDNGIGMNEHIFENFFLQIGRSYYKSSEFRISGVKIDPVSEFGIGILSIFMVANEVKVESMRKPLDPLHPFAPINIEIPSAYDYFVQRPPIRSQIGTKITLSLKPNHPFSPSTLIKKISEIAPFIEYKVIIETSKGLGKYEPLLPGEIRGHNPHLKEYFRVTFNESDKSEGIEGTLRVVQSSKNNGQLIAQRGFSIPPDKLVPRWIYENIKMSINISGQTKLSLSSSRLNIINDKKYYKLIKKIQLRLLKELKNNLKAYRDSNTLEKYIEYVNELLIEDILSFKNYRTNFGFEYEQDKLRESMKRIFIDNVPLLTVFRDGNLNYKMIKDFDNLSKVVIISKSDQPERIKDENIFKEIEDLINPDLIILLGNGQVDVKKYGFLDKILGEASQIYITSIPGVVLEIFEKETNSRNFIIDINYFTYEMHSKNGTNKPLFVHYPGSFWDPDDVIYNANHQLLYRFFEGMQPRDEKSLEALKYLYYTFNSLLNDLVSIVISDTYTKNIEPSDNQNFMLVGFIENNPEILEEFYNAAMKFWKNAQNVGAISCDEEFPGFTVEDLPWFWSYA